MRAFSHILTAFAVAAAALPYPAVAQEAATERAENGEHYRLLKVMETEEVKDGLAQAAVRGMISVVLQSDPAFAQLAEENAEFKPTVTRLFLPVFQRQVETNLGLAFPLKQQLLEANLTAEEATQLADFYEQPLGQALILGTINNLDYSTVISDENPGETISADGILNETNKSANAMAMEKVQEMTLEDRRKVLELVASPAFQKFQKLNPQMAQITADIENRPLAPELEVEMTNIWIAVFDELGIG